MFTESSATGSSLNPDGSTKSIIYPNDPSDPTKIADSSVPGYPVIDFLPGYTPKDHMGTPLVPVDPDDRTKGYIPPIPSDIGKDTTITYTADSQKATVTLCCRRNRNSTSHR